MTQIAIVVYPRFTALDLVGPYEVLRGLPGADIRFVAHEPGPVVADSGVLAIGATHAFDETPTPEIVLVLAAAGLLEGRRATTHWSSLRLLPMFGAVAVDDERIVVEADRRIATAAGVSAGIDLALWLAAQVAGEDRARAIQLTIEYDPQPPFDSGHRSKASKSTVAASTALLSRDLIEPTTMADGVALAWQGTLATIRRKARRRR
jgi:transcriptional regulator GlxA family with amidase domain